jgi:hypothetical protein
MGAKYAAAIVFSLCATAFPFLADSARADEIAIAFDTDRFWDMGGGVSTFGWQFTARSDIQISSLGLYDNPSAFDGGFPGDGLLDSHEIGIWDVADPSIPLVSALIPAGTGVPLLNGFRFVDIGPVTLSANHDYVIAALYPSQDPISQDETTGSFGGFDNPDFVLTVSPKIEFGGYRANPDVSIFAFPEYYEPGVLYAFGPNFTIVPEPSSLALILLGLMALLLSCKVPIRLGKGTKGTLLIPAVDYTGGVIF